EDRAGGRLRVVERIGAQPGCEGRPVFATKASLEELRRLCLAIELGGEPAVEGIAVVDPLLSCQGGKTFSSNSEPTRFGVIFCAYACPPSCLVPAPRGSHGNQGQYHRLDNFNRFKTGLRRRNVLAHLI